MMTMLGGAVRPVAELASEEWRNGSGSTRVVSVAAEAAHPASPASPGPAWRVSIATVTDGAAFSSFPGYRRAFLPLHPGSIRLTGEAGELAAGPDGRVHFDGSDAVTAHVTGGIAWALNVMTSRGWRSEIVEVARDGRHSYDDPRIRALILLSGSAAMPGRDRMVDGPAAILPGSDVDHSRARVLEIRITKTEQELP